jgi:hypothetical protein
VPECGDVSECNELKKMYYKYKIIRRSSSPLCLQLEKFFVVVQSIPQIYAIVTREL